MAPLKVGRVLFFLYPLAIISLWSLDIGTRPELPFAVVVRNFEDSSRMYSDISCKQYMSRNDKTSSAALLVVSNDRACTRTCR